MQSEESEDFMAVHISIVCAGRIKEKYISDGIGEFEKRLRPFAKTEFLEIREERMQEDPSPAEKARILDAEGRRLLAQVPENSYLYVLDLRGKEFSSEEFALHLSKLSIEGKSQITFLIGGPFGISEEVRKTADTLISFSRLTFTHQMVRLLLLEQIYRAFKINRREKYHW